MPNQAIAKALSRVHRAAKPYGGAIVRSRDLTQEDKTLLTRTNWLQEIMRGWFMLIRPDLLPGDTSAWYANFWDFVRVYLEEVYGENYCLSAGNSIDLHIGNSIIPKQVVAIVAQGGGNPLILPFETSLLTYADAKNIPAEQTRIRGIRVMTLSFALCKIAPVFFHQHPLDAAIALRSLDIQELLHVLATHHFVRGADRIVGALQALNEQEKCEILVDGLKQVGVFPKPINPFTVIPAITGFTFHSPYQERVRDLWLNLRPTIVECFPSPPGLPKNPSAYLHELEELYPQDAYHSLSIEGYQVDMDLIQRVHQNEWDPDHLAMDQQRMNALAARGYYEAFIAVKQAIVSILQGQSPGEIVKRELQGWFQKLFSPHIQVGLFKPSDVIGYRRHSVYIRNSRHVPLPREALSGAMEAFFSCVQEEVHPAVRAVLGHFLFVYIHPYMDGNGRLGRFIMNTMLASGGYPWTVIPVKHRAEYFSSLEKVSVNQDIRPFTSFLAQEMQSSQRRSTQM